MSPSKLPFLVALTLAGCDPATPAASSASSSSSAAPSGPLKVGDAAPAIKLALHDGTTVDLASLKDKLVLVYFYPKDDTPGCTIEAQGVRDAWGDFQAAGVTVYGVSTQDAGSHKSFIDKHSLPFPLVVDEGGLVAKAFGVPLKNGLSARQSFLIGKDGRIKAVWPEVSPADHAKEVLAAAKS